jgi:hypothetical protein
MTGGNGKKSRNLQTPCLRAKKIELETSRIVVEFYERQAQTGSRNARKEFIGIRLDRHKPRKTSVNLSPSRDQDRTSPGPTYCGQQHRVYLLFVQMHSLSINKT